MHIYQFVSSRDLCQPQEAIEPTYLTSRSKKGESKEKRENRGKMPTTTIESKKANSPKKFPQKAHKFGQSNEISQ